VNTMLLIILLIYRVNCCLRIYSCKTTYGCKYSTEFKEIKDPVHFLGNLSRGAEIRSVDITNGAYSLS